MDNSASAGRFTAATDRVSRSTLRLTTAGVSPGRLCEHCRTTNLLVADMRNCGRGHVQDLLPSRRCASRRTSCKLCSASCRSIRRSASVPTRPGRWPSLARAVSCWQLAGEDNDAAVVLCWPITLRLATALFRRAAWKPCPSAVSGFGGLRRLGRPDSSSAPPWLRVSIAGRWAWAARLTVVLWRVCSSASASWRRWRSCWRVGARSWSRAGWVSGRRRWWRPRADARLGSGTRFCVRAGRSSRRDFAFGVVRQLFERRFATRRCERARRVAGRPGWRGATAAVGRARRARRAFDTSFAVLHGLYWLTANLADRPAGADRRRRRALGGRAVAALVGASCAAALEGLAVALLVALRPVTATSTEASLAALRAEAIDGATPGAVE